MQQPTTNKQCTLAQTHKQFGAWINAVVHSIMYLYYGLTAARFNTAPFKQAVTSVQLTQFCMCIAHAVTVVVVPNEVPHNLAMLQFGYHCTMITLFGQFYYASYIAPAQKKKAEKKAALAKHAAAAEGAKKKKSPRAS
jgi:hypothetical protein